MYVLRREEKKCKDVCLCIISFDSNEEEEEK